MQTKRKDHVTSQQQYKHEIQRQSEWNQNEIRMRSEWNEERVTTINMMKHKNVDIYKDEMKQIDTRTMWEWVS